MTSSIFATSGIYRITCTSSGRFYIGSSVNMQKRLYEHVRLLRNTKHTNPKLQGAWNVYGEGAFAFEVIEFVPIPDFLIEREQYWLDTLAPFGQKGFNIAISAQSAHLGLKHSSEAIERISKNRRGKPAHNLGMKSSPETIEKKRQAMIGRKASPETRERMRIRMMGNTINQGREHTPEQRKRVGDAQRGIPLTPEHRAKLIGRTRSHESSESISKRMTGNKHGLGKIPSPEKREKIRQSHLGKKMSPETAALISAANTGRKYDTEVYDSRKKTYIVTSPEGIEYTVHGIRQFAKEHNLNNSHLIRVAKGDYKQHKGWLVRYTD